MKVIILGSGIAASDFPDGREERFPPAVLVDLGTTLVLLDCGEGARFRIRQAGYRYTDVEHIALTQPHPDHCAITHFLQSVHVRGVYWGDKREDWHLHAPAQVKDNWYQQWNFALPERPDQDFGFPKLHWHVMGDGTERELDGAKLTSYHGHHGWGKVEVLIFRLEHDGKVLTYVGDTGPTRGLLKAAQDADLFICEAAAPIGTENPSYGHLTPKHAGQYAAKAGAKKLILTHYSGRNTDEEMVEDARSSGYDGEIVIAKDLQVYNL